MPPIRACDKEGGEVKLKRFNITPPDKWGQQYISDVCNTEPVCLIYSRYHPYAAPLILDALNAYEKEARGVERLRETLKELNEPELKELEAFE